MISPLFTLSTQIYQAYSRLAEVKRKINLKTTDRAESTVEHSFHLVLTCIGICDYFKMDEKRTTKIIKLAAIHDLHEYLSGDICSISQHTESERKEYALREKRAIEELQSTFSMWPELSSLLNEYDAGTSYESRFVNALDKIVPFFLEIDNSFASTISKGVAYEDLRKNRLGVVDNAPLAILKDLMNECLTNAENYLD